MGISDSTRQGVWDVADGGAISEPEEGEHRRAGVRLVPGAGMAPEEDEQRNHGHERIEREAYHSHLQLRIQQLHPLGP